MNTSNETSQNVHSCSFHRNDSGIAEWQPKFLTGEMSATLTSVTIFNLLLSPCAIVLNIMVMTAVKTTPRLRNRYNALLACLVVTDVLTGALGQPLSIAKQIHRLTGSFASDYCNIEQSGSLFYGAFVVASLHHLTLISIERYVAIKYPYKYQDIVTKPRLIGSVLAAWSFAMFPSLVSLFVNNSSAFFVLLRPSAVLMSIFILTFCHIAVYHEARKQIQKIKNQQVCAQAKETFLKERKALKTTTLALGAVLAAALPILLFRIVLIFHISSPVVFFALEAAFETLALCNAVCNPLIYCARSSEYRAAFKKLLGCKKSQIQPCNELT